ncbi:MAG: hypothetical protein ACK4K7_03350 [Allosphingosinicella sp.]|uniref:hypothetical protein n=1 Tax=Allosphingosinicella sp. TaxID=2823234 RepID=UPI00395D5342
MRLFLVLLAALAGPAWAQPRVLELPASASWQHERTSLIVPPRSGPFTRGEISDAGEAELDVMAQFDMDGGRTRATLYLFKTGVPDTALWFDRAQASISLRAEWNAVPVADAPLPFALPGRPATGLYSAYRLPTGGDWRSTAVALAPLHDGWLVKLRISSADIEAEQLQASAAELLAGLRWPAPTSAEVDAAAARPIRDCAAPLRLRRARLVQPSMADVLIAAATGAMPATGPKPTYCREPGPRAIEEIYRPNGSTRSYLIALGDSGLAVSLGQSLSLAALSGGRGGGSFTTMLIDREGVGVYPSFDRLPLPEQALQVLGSRAMISARQGEAASSKP